MRAALALLLTAGCFSKPGPPGGDACTPSKPSAPGLTTTDGPAPLVTLPNGTAFGFASDLGGYPFPDRIRLGATNVVADHTTCLNEDQVGLAAFPVYMLAARTPVSGPLHSLDRGAVGAAVASFQVNWRYATPSACSGGTRTSTGNATFAIYPDGRVVRNDTLDVTNDILSTTGCTCSPGAQAFVVTSYTALDSDRLTGFTPAGGASGGLPAESSGVPGLDGGCVEGNAGHVAIRWDRIGTDPPIAPTRIRVPPRDQVHEIAFVYDWVPPGAGGMEIAPTTYDLRTHMMLDASSTPTCPDLNTALAGWVTAPALTIDDALVPLHATGTYRDAADKTYTQAFTVRAASGSIPPGFVIRVAIPDYAAVATDRPAERVIWQREDDGTFYIFFRDGLTNGDSIEIQPEC